MREPVPSQSETANDAAASMPVLRRHHVVVSSNNLPIVQFSRQGTVLHHS
ncbi:hypothetical protein M422DRAFT_244287 [Sphaerobolus stellatus SS14]|nr:hypothetical protein M422DRAFT_244287 [Sphaerobolus stellatus SS14]